MVRWIGIAVASLVLGTGIVVADKAARDDSRTPQTSGPASKKWDGKYYVTIDGVTSGQLKCPSVDDKRVYKITNGKLSVPLFVTNPAWHDMSDEDLGLCVQKPSAKLCGTYRDTLDKLKGAKLPTDLDAPLGELAISFDAKGVASGELKTQPLRVLGEPDAETSEVVNEVADLAVTGGSLRVDNKTHLKGKTGGVSIKTVVPLGSHNVDESCDLDITATDYQDTRKHVPTKDHHCSGTHTCRNSGECSSGCTTCVGATADELGTCE